ncbi:MAG: rhodanese-like domain-containing protein [Fimbriimonadales bacterium]|nr:rhodanese-like domain-containing protein [Fimbriimonadales bacterium]MDW8051152.1 rhodanese-like domain-containing protein [Armatimonadota bacterium]
MIFRQICEEGLAQASYFFGCPAMGEAGEAPEDKPVIVYCYVDDRFSLAGSALRTQGFRNLYNLTGGIAARQEKGLPLTQHN